MGVVSILLGIIAFIGFTGAGAVAGNAVINFKNSMGVHLLSLNGISNGGIMAAFIGIFSFIGLLICVSMVMQGLTYNKIVKIQKRVNRL